MGKLLIQHTHKIFKQPSSLFLIVKEGDLIVKKGEHAEGKGKIPRRHLDAPLLLRYKDLSSSINEHSQ